MLEFLCVTVSLIFFLNKILILVGRKSGWLVGVIGAILAIAYFLLINLYLFTILEFGLIVLMGYGFFVKEKKNPITEKFIHLTIFIVMTFLTFFAFTGMLTVYEFVGAILMLLGTYFLTHEKLALGWLLYGLAHLFSAYVVSKKPDQDFFVNFQLASFFVSCVGFFISKNKGII